MNGRDAKNLLLKAGWIHVRTGRHYIMRHPESGAVCHISLGTLDSGAEKAFRRRAEGKIQKREIVQGNKL